MASSTSTPVNSKRHPVLDRVGEGAGAASPARRRGSQPAMRFTRRQSRRVPGRTVSPSPERTELVERAARSPSNRLVEVLKDSALEGTGNYTLKRGFRTTRAG